MGSPLEAEAKTRTAGGAEVMILAANTMLQHCSAAFEAAVQGIDVTPWPRVAL
ncbi:MAG: hypothetical protein MK098_05345 [Marinovum sp.]|nr:hypothetical protein [Marinovum sp.]